MTFMSFLLLIVLFLAFFIYCTWLNPDDITLYYLTDHSVTFSPAVLILGFILLGLIIGYGAHIYSVLVHGLKHWKEEREEKRSREVGAIYREGISRLLSGDLKKASTLLQKALDRDPKRIDSYIAMANVHLQEGDAQAAVKLLQKARELDRNSLEVLFKLATTHEGAGDLAEARETYQAILKIEAGNRKALRSLRDLAMKEESWEEALDLQKKVIKVSAGSRRADEEAQNLRYLRYEVARTKLERGESEAAAGELQDIVREDPQFVPARVSLGDAQEAQNRSAEAVRAWQKGYFETGRSVFLSRLEDFYMKAEDPATLLAFYRSTIAEKQDDMVLRMFFGKLCLRLEMVDEAVDQLFAVESSGAESSQLHFLLGEAYRRRNRKDDAIKEYKKALGANKHLRLAYVCDKCGEHHPEWHSRCKNCRAWSSLSMVNRQLFREARLLDIREIHHGER